MFSMEPIVAKWSCQSMHTRAMLSNEVQELPTRSEHLHFHQYELFFDFWEEKWFRFYYQITKSITCQARATSFDNEWMSMQNNDRRVVVRRITTLELHIGVSLIIQSTTQKTLLVCQRFNSQNIKIINSLKLNWMKQQKNYPNRLEIYSNRKKSKKFYNNKKKTNKKFPYMHSIPTSPHHKTTISCWYKTMTIARHRNSSRCVRPIKSNTDNWLSRNWILQTKTGIN